MAAQQPFPPATSPHLVLTSPTREELAGTWAATYPSWGAALDLQGYLDREAFLSDQPLAEGDHITPWILTDSSAAPEERQVLSSCETLRARALVKNKDGTVREGWAHGVASVFTYTDRRGHGYAAKMMEQLAQTLRARQGEKDGDALFSVLFSDIGKKFYAKRGWAPFESTHLQFPARAALAQEPVPIKTIQLEDLPELVRVDNQLIRSRLFTPGQPIDKRRVALLPDHDTFMRHLHRETFMCNRLFNRAPTTHGAIYGAGSAHRVWAIWTRSFYGPLAKPEKNTLYILRLVVEDDGISDEQLQDALKAILSAAQSEAKEWQLPRVEMWNPDERVKRLVSEAKELEASYVEREEDGIASLQWHGDGADDEIEWVVNEKFEWC